MFIYNDTTKLGPPFHDTLCKDIWSLELKGQVLFQNGWECVIERDYLQVMS